MKKYIFMAAAMLFAMASCTNEVEEQNVAKKIPVKLTATLSEGPETRATYTDNAGLKASWDATEKITVVSLDAYGVVVAMDDLTSTGAAGRTSAEFTGTITENPNTKSYICWYPALNGTNNTVTTTSVGREYNNWSLSPQHQERDNDLTRLAQRSVYNGKPTFNNGEMSVSLQSQLTVFKFALTLPDDAVGNICYQVQVTSTRPTFYPSSWSYANSTELYNAASSYGNTAILNYVDHKTITSGDKTITAYLLANKPKAAEAGDKWTITAAGKSKTLTWKNGKTFEKGKVYTINATLE